MPLDDQTLSTLLRLKRFEQPPPGYFDDFLHEFQTRQRMELLRRPAWRIALDRLATLWNPNITLARFSYASASFAVLCVAGALTFNMLQHPGSSVGASAEILAANATRNTPVIKPAMQVASAPRARTINAALSPQIRIPDGMLDASVAPVASGQHPRYILDTRPVSYEPPFSF
ncbi:MAG: hypothetical protein NTZ46_03225 [Verrucomicrobia bacterium]|nr:hypothetical protein [Verrucomicrobiota bacterium]